MERAQGIVIWAYVILPTLVELSGARWANAQGHHEDAAGISLTVRSPPHLVTISANLTGSSDLPHGGGMLTRPFRDLAMCETISVR